MIIVKRSVKDQHQGKQLSHQKNLSRLLLHLKDISRISPTKKIDNGEEE